MILINKEVILVSKAKEILLSAYRIMILKIFRFLRQVTLIVGIAVALGNVYVVAARLQSVLVLKAHSGSLYLISSLFCDCSIFLFSSYSSLVTGGRTK